MILHGNMGKNEDKNIEEIDNLCKSNSCLFFVGVQVEKMSQVSKKHISYVLDNYNLCEKYNIYDVYCNDK